jgi:RNA polymerase primary sigma factor
MKEIRIEKLITHRSQDSLERYLKEISKYPLLEAEEEIVLAEKIRRGDEAALHRLVNCNLRFVITVAKKYETQDISLADLVSDGNIGLIKAAERFDEKRGFKFISYAVWWIQQAILSGMGTHKRMIHLPRNQVDGIRETWKSEIKLEQQLHRMPTRQELAVFMQLGDDTVYDYRRFPGIPLSLDAPAKYLDARLEPAIIPYAMEPAPDASLEEASLQKDIQLLMRVLSPRERNILKLAFGMEGDRPLQNEDISQVLGLSAETIRRSKIKALDRLRQLKGIEFLRQYH